MAEEIKKASFARQREIDCKVSREKRIKENLLKAKTKKKRNMIPADILKAKKIEADKARLEAWSFERLIELPCGCQKRPNPNNRKEMLIKPCEVHRMELVK